MRSTSARFGNAILAAVVISFSVIGCGHMPPVATLSTCTLAWDKVDDPHVSFYRVIVRPNSQAVQSAQEPIRVPAPNTTVPCKSAGATHDGQWLAIVQACTKGDVCSSSSRPFIFTIKTP